MTPLPLTPLPEPSVSLVGARFTPDTPPAEVERIGAAAASGAKQCLFVLADCVNHHITHFGGSLSKWSELTGMDEKSIHTVAGVGKKVPIEKRREGLSFDHHRKLAALPEGQQEFWANQAEAEHLSSKQLSKSIQAGEVVKGIQHRDPGDKGQDNLTVHVTRIRTLMRKFEEKGVLDLADEDQLFALHRDLLPVLEAHGKIVKRLLKAAGQRVKSAFALDMRKLAGGQG